MAKRFSETTKWNDDWFMELESQYKLFWLYLLDNVDHSGLWRVNFKLASFQIGSLLVPERVLEVFANKIKVVKAGVWFVPKFIDFQYGKLEPKNRVHASVLAKLEKYKLNQGPSKDLNSPIDGVKDKDKEKDKDKFKAKALEEDKEKEQVKEKAKDREKDKDTQFKIFDTVTTVPKNVEANRATWEAYREAYQNRWKVDPVRNVKVNAMVWNFVKRVGSEDAPGIIKFFVNHNDSYYVKSLHSFSLALRDAEGLRTQWLRGKPITDTDMRQYQKTSHLTAQLSRIERGEA